MFNGSATGVLRLSSRRLPLGSLCLSFKCAPASRMPGPSAYFVTAVSPRLLPMRFSVLTSTSIVSARAQTCWYPDRTTQSTESPCKLRQASSSCSKQADGSSASCLSHGLHLNAMAVLRGSFMHRPDQELGSLRAILFARLPPRRLNHHREPHQRQPARAQRHHHLVLQLQLRNGRLRPPKRSPRPRVNIACYLVLY